MSDKNINWQPAIILLLLATTVLFFGLYVTQLASSENRQPVVQHQDSGQENQVIEWRLVTSWPKNFPGLGSAPEFFAEKVYAMSDGRLKITVHGGGEIVPPLGVFDAVSNGSVEMGHSGAYYWKGKAPAVSPESAADTGE